MSTTTNKNFAQTGKLKTLLGHILTAARTNTVVLSVMDGKNNSIIQETTKSFPVNNSRNARKIIVRISTQSMIEDKV